MNRDTAVAIWYRRIDPRCFTTETPSDAGADARRLANPSHDDQTDWLQIEAERTRRVLGTLVERLHLGRSTG